MDISILHLIELDTGKLSIYCVKDDYIEPSMIEQMIADLGCPLDAQDDFEWSEDADGWVCTHPNFTLETTAICDTSEVILYRMETVMKTYFMNPNFTFGIAEFRVDKDLLVGLGFKVFKSEELMCQAKAESEGISLNEASASCNTYSVGSGGMIQFHEGHTDCTTTLKTSFIAHASKYQV